MANSLANNMLRKPRMMTFPLLISLFFGLSLAFTTSAQDSQKTLPAKGTTNLATYLTAQTLAEQKMEEVAYHRVQEMVGITRNTGGESYFDNMSVHCLGYVRQVNGEWFWTGACTETDSDSDQIFLTFDMEARYIVGGTGKYQGISGKAPYKENSSPKISPTRNAAIVDHEMTWEIK